MGLCQRSRGGHNRERTKLNRSCGRPRRFADDAERWGRLGKIIARKCEIPLYKFCFSGIMHLIPFFGEGSTHSFHADEYDFIPGPVAQLGECCVRNAEVEGSNPFGSTKMC